MITEDYVSFETAKLLKEKGFDKAVLITDWWYNAEGQAYKRGNYSYGGAPFYDKETCFNCPTLQMAMKGLREKHNLHCVVDYDFALGWYCEITSLKETTEYDYEEMKHYHPDHNYGFSTPEEACEEAVKYCLENLI